MMLNVAVSIDRFAVALTLYRHLPATYDLDGNAIVADPVAEPFRGTIQASSAKSGQFDGNRLQDLPEGVRMDAQWALWTRTSIAVEDVVQTADGSRYRVSWIWPRAEGGFTRASLGLLK